jgi:hypothetical protein
MVAVQTILMASIPTPTIITTTTTAIIMAIMAIIALITKAGTRSLHHHIITITITIMGIMGIMEVIMEVTPSIDIMDIDQIINWFPIYI